MDSSVLIYMFKADLYFEYIPSMAKVNLPPYTFKYLSYNKHIPIHGSRIFFQPGGGGSVGYLSPEQPPSPLGSFSGPPPLLHVIRACLPNHVITCPCGSIFVAIHTDGRYRGIASPESLSFLYRVINFYLPSSSK